VHVLGIKLSAAKKNSELFGYLSGGGRMLNGNLYLSRKDDLPLWMTIEKWVTDRVEPLVLKTKMVKPKPGFNLRVAGATFLTYQGKVLEQVKHLDCGDPNAFSCLIPLSDDVPSPVIVADEHQPRKDLQEWLDQHNWTELTPKMMSFLGDKKQRATWRKIFSLPKYRGQNFNVAAESQKRMRLLDMFFMHWIVHGAPPHEEIEYPRVVAFLQLQYTDKKVGRYSANEQIYLGPTTIGMCCGTKVYFEEIITCIHNLGSASLLLHNVNWWTIRPSTNSEREMFLAYINYVRRKFPNITGKYSPEKEEGVFLQSHAPEESLKRKAKKDLEKPKKKKK
jgi:hypothetical protein